MVMRRGTFLSFLACAAIFSSVECAIAARSVPMASTRLHAGGLAHDAMRLRGGAGNRNLKGAADEQKEATIEKKISPNRLMVQVPNRFGCPSSTTHRPPSSPRFSRCIVNRNVHMPPGTRKEHSNTPALSMLEARAPLVHAETARFPGSLFET